MALLGMDGFEDYSDVTEFLQDSKWMGTASSTSFTTGRLSGQALRITNSVTFYFSLSQVSTSTIYVGFAFQADSYPSSDSPIQNFIAPNGDSQCFLYFDSSGQLSVRRAAANILGTSTSSVNLGVWNYIVLKLVIHDSTGTAELWLNGTKEVNVTGQDTKGSATYSTVNSIYLRGQSARTFDYDDFYVGDSSGSDMTDQVGDCHIEMVTPDANGTTNNFTASPAVSNYLNVDDGNNPDDDTTYNYSATATHKELYGCNALTSNVDTVYAVMVKARMRKEDAGNRLFNFIARSSTVESDSGQMGLAIQYSYMRYMYENDPNGGGAWSESSVNAAEFGLEIGT